MAGRRLSMRRTREILRQKWALGTAKVQFAHAAAVEAVSKYCPVFK